MSPRTVADAIAAALAAARVRRVFVPADAPSRVQNAAAAAGLEIVAAPTESTAAVMAAASAEVAAAPAALVVASPEGVARAVAGLEIAFRRRAPTLVISTLGAGAAFDATALLAPLVKSSVTIDAASPSSSLADAAALAMRHPRGPVHVDVSPAVAALPAGAETTVHRDARTAAPRAAALDAAAKTVADAARPLVVAGLGAASAEAAPWVRAFAETVPAPVLVTPGAKGVLPDPHPLHLGLWRRGEPIVERADLVVALGVDPIDIGAGDWPPTSAVLRLGPVDVIPPSYQVPHDVVGDVAAILQELAPRLRDRPRADWNLAEVDRLRRHARARGCAEPDERARSLARLVRVVREATPAATLVTADGALADPVLACWDAVAPDECLVALPETRPFALAAALGARLAAGERPLVCFTDGATLVLAVAEIALAARLARPLIVLVAPPLPADVRALAGALGVDASVVEGEAALPAALARALAAPGPVLVATRTV